jgi:UDP-3-O-[3-hydroxymyristoyl] N-acetylglucosamine deacetylase/3-hydroxyacyl-[acyl-carrier-protein] dehydratase
MPGVLIVEAMAQTGGILLLNALPDLNEKLVYFMQINNVKFRKPVVPGDQLFLEIELTNQRSKVFTMKGKTFVNDVLVCEAEFMAGIVDRDNKLENQ